MAKFCQKALALKTIRVKTIFKQVVKIKQLNGWNKNVQCCRVLRRGRDKGKKYIIRAKGERGRGKGRSGIMRGEEGKVEVG